MLKDKLAELYNDGSKHSRYQNIPEFVKKELGYTEKIDENWRGDTARYNYLVDNVKFGDGLNVGEIGANTGFFTLSLANANPDSRFYAYEINDKHAEFIEDIAESFKMSNVFVKPLGIDLAGIDKMEEHDLLLNYNVLHHAGVDFDKGMIVTVDDYEGYAIKYLDKLRSKTKRMVFQIGYNWGGNKLKPIIPLADDAEKIAFTTRLFKESGWEIEDISLHTRENNQLEYKPVPSEIVKELNESESGYEKKLVEEKIDLSSMPDYSEFYRRPIFIVKRKG